MRPGEFTANANAAGTGLPDLTWQVCDPEEVARLRSAVRELATHLRHLDRFTDAERDAVLAYADQLVGGAR